MIRRRQKRPLSQNCLPFVLRLETLSEGVTLINTCSRVTMKSEVSRKMWAQALSLRTVIKGDNDKGS